MNKPWSRRLAFAAALSLCAIGTASAQEKLRIAGNFTDKHSSSIAIEQFKKDVEQATGGKGQTAGPWLVHHEGSWVRPRVPRRAAWVD